MGGAYGMNGRNESCILGFREGNLGKEIDHMEDLSVDMRIILKRLLKKDYGVTWNRFI